MSEIIADAIIDAGTLQQYVDVFTPLVAEGRIHFNDDGITTAVCDSANVAMIAPGRLDAAAFESYDAPGAATIGVSFDTLSERLGAANSGDLVRLRVDMETRKLKLDYRNISQSVGMIDPDAIRQDPDTPDIDLPNTMTVEAGALDEAATVIDMVTDHLGIDARPDDREVALIGQGDIDDTEVVFGDEETISADVPEDTWSLFSLEYVEELIDPMPADAEVTLTFGDEFPMLLDWEACEGRLTVHQMLAPRIESE